MKPTTTVSVFASKFENHIDRVLGRQALHDLRSCFSDLPVILLSGDQLTGKSTAASIIGTQRSVKTGGTGGIVREMAADAGVPVEEMSLRLENDPDADVKLDFSAARSIATGTVGVFEARLAGYLGAWLRSLGRKNLFSAYLFCPPSEQALRYVYREVSPDARIKVEELAQLPPEADLAACLRIITECSIPEVQGIDRRVEEIAERDELSAGRLLELYGVDHRDTSVFDLIVDTSSGAPEKAAITIRNAAAKGVERLRHVLEHR